MKSIIKLGIAEDHQLLRETIIKCLNREKNIQFTLEAKNGEELINNICKTNVQIILLDLNMPIMDGWQTLKILTSKHPLIKVIILSMYNSDTQIIKAIRLGARAFLSKDCSMDILINAIESVHFEGYYYDKKSYRALHFNTMSISTDTTNFQNNLLTPRERQILELICEGKTNKEISEKLFLSIRTIESHRKSILNKTECCNVASLVVFAIKHKLYEIEASF